MTAFDAVNARFGRNTVRTAAQTIGGSARLTQQNRLSPCYTTKWKDALTIQVGYKSGSPWDVWIPGRGWKEDLAAKFSFVGYLENATEILLFEPFEAHLYAKCMQKKSELHGINRITR